MYRQRRILIFRLDHVEKMRSREQVCIICLIGLPTGKKPFSVNKHCALGEKCCASRCVALFVCLFCLPVEYTKLLDYLWIDRVILLGQGKAGCQPC
jgi:hypothetical protein